MAAMISHGNRICVATCLAHVLTHWREAVEADADTDRKTEALAHVRKGMTLALWTIDTGSGTIGDPSLPMRAGRLLKEFRAAGPRPAPADPELGFGHPVELAPEQRLTLLARSDGPGN